MLKKTWFLMVGAIIVSSILIVLFVRQADKSVKFVPDLCSFDSSPLRIAISACNKIQILCTDKTKEVLYETEDAEEIRWVIDSLIVKDANSRRSTLMSLSRFSLVFYRDSEPVVRLMIKKQSRFYWFQGSWDWKSDFWLTDESYGKLMPWLCEKSGKSEHELFFPDMGTAIRGQEKGSSRQDKPGVSGLDE